MSTAITTTSQLTNAIIAMARCQQSDCQGRVEAEANVAICDALSAAYASLATAIRTAQCESHDTHPEQAEALLDAALVAAENEEMPKGPIEGWEYWAGACVAEHVRVIERVSWIARAIGQAVNA